MPVPPGTLVFDAASGKLAGELKAPGDSLLVAGGGAGDGGGGGVGQGRCFRQGPRPGAISLAGTGTATGGKEGPHE